MGIIFFKVYWFGVNWLKFISRCDWLISFLFISELLFAFLHSSYSSFRVFLCEYWSFILRLAIFWLIFWKILQYWQESTCVGVSFFNKVTACQASRPTTLLKRDSSTNVFLWILRNFLITVFLLNTFGGYFWILDIKIFCSF